MSLTTPTRKPNPNRPPSINLMQVLCPVQRCTATSYNVGDTSGWDISTNLDTWPIGKTFKVGDVLVFQYSSLHSVCEVSKDGYDNCDSSGAVLRSSNGNTSIPLTTPGNKYFICGTLSHCLGGMKLQVSVAGAAVADNSPASAPLPQPASGLDPSSPSNNRLPTQPSLANTPKNSLLLSAASFCVYGALLWMAIV
ncbi:hypothetical protein ACLOJK_033857 [Asimina triloba]